MTYQKKLHDYTVEELDLELVARGANISAFQFQDQEGTLARFEIMAQTNAFYQAVHGNKKKELECFSDQELLDVILKKAQEIKNKLRAIWLVDDRKDLFEIKNEQLLKNAGGTALICQENDLLAAKETVSTLKVKNYGESFNLCDSEPFRMQPVLTGWLCTGFLVKDDVIATAGHCANAKNVKDLRIVFGYHMSDTQNVAREIPSENIYRGAELIARKQIRQDAESDWALVRLDRKVKGQIVPTLSSEEIFPGQQAYVIGYPMGLPVKIAPGAQICDINKTCFVATLDIYSGNSGSPVFCSDTNKVIGMVVRGENRDFRWTGKGWTSVIYPNFHINSRGTQCTRVTEFIDIVNNL